MNDAAIDAIAHLLVGSKIKSFEHEISERTIQRELQTIRQTVIKQFRLLKRVEGFCMMCLTQPLPGIAQDSYPALVQLPFRFGTAEEKQTLYSIYRAIAEHGAAALVVTVGEVWMSLVQRMDEQVALEHYKHHRPADDPQRQEFVSVTILSRYLKPQRQQLLAKIFRPRGQRPFLGPFLTMDEYARSQGHGDSVTGVKHYGSLVNLDPSMKRDN